MVSTSAAMRDGQRKVKTGESGEAAVKSSSSAGEILRLKHPEKGRKGQRQRGSTIEL